MNENEFEYNGIKLTAKEKNPYNPDCKGCYFEYKKCPTLTRKNKIPDCISDFRKDGREVIFVEVENERN